MSGVARMRDAGKFIKTVTSVRPVSVGGATTNGVAVDRLGYESCKLHLGVGLGTVTSVDCKLQDSADGSTGWADIAAAVSDPSATAQLTANQSDANVSIDLSGVRRYVRAVVTTVGTAILIQATIALGGAAEVPAEAT